MGSDAARSLRSWHRVVYLSSRNNIVGFKGWGLDRRSRGHVSRLLDL